MSTAIVERIGALGLLPVIVLDDPERAVPLVDALSEAGLPAAEITFRTAAASAAIERVAGARPDVLLGAGTVSTVDQADRVIGAGAKFIVAPGVNPRVVEHVAKQGIPIFPGVCTPTDIETAISLGLSVLKLFPIGAMGGLKLLRALAAPYGHLVKFIPTGGVTAANLRDYLAEPSVIACGGSWIVAKGLVEAGSFAEISELTKQAMEIVKNAAGERA